VEQLKNVTNLAQHRHPDTDELLEYLAARLQVNDLAGIVVQSIGRDGKERVHMTGCYRHNPQMAAGAALTLSVQMARTAGEYND
jgi:hypothetical protein